MNTTININLNGLAFTADNDAYKRLKEYLDKVEKRYFDDKEIVNDIEARLSELFTEYLSKLGHQVINIDDVNRAIEQIGEPEEMEESPEYATKPAKKKLYRDTMKGFIGGVSSGLAAYTGWDVSIFRMIWILLFLFTNCIASVAYILFWIIVPDAKTPAQRLEMKGLPSTEDNINKEREDIISTTSTNSGCLSALGKIIIVASALFLIFPLIFILLLLVGIFGLAGAGISVPLFAGLNGTLVSLALIAIICCPIAALIYLAVTLKESKPNKKRRNLIVYLSLLLAFILGITYFAVNSKIIDNNVEEWTKPFENFAESAFSSEDWDGEITSQQPDSFYITIKTNYCGDYAPAISGTYNNWSKEKMTQVNDTTWKIAIPSDMFNEIKFQDSKGDWSNEIKYFDVETQAWKKLDNIHLSNNANQEFDFSNKDIYRWSKCH